MRLPIIETVAMTPEQREVHDATLAGKRGTVPPPVECWLHSPPLAARAQALGEFVRYDTVLPKPLSEMAILLVARHWTSHYEWFAHKRIAIEVGLRREIIDAILERRPPPLETEEARAIYYFTTALLRDRSVPEHAYDAVVAHFGSRGVVELVGLLGYYGLVSMTLNTFEVGLPGGARSDFDQA